MTENTNTPSASSCVGQAEAERVVVTRDVTVTPGGRCPVADTATRVRVWVHREADGYLLSVSSLPPDRSDVSADDIVTEQDVWIEEVTS